MNNTQNALKNSSQNSKLKVTEIQLRNLKGNNVLPDDMKQAIKENKFKDLLEQINILFNSYQESNNLGEKQLLLLAYLISLVLEILITASEEK